MKNWFNATDRTDLLRRLERLTPDAKPQWGRLTPAALVCHLADPVRVALGEKHVKPFNTLLALPGIAHLAVWVFPWPKGAPTPPEFLPGQGMTNPTEFERDKRTLVVVLGRFSNVAVGQCLEPSPGFGRLSRAAWGRLVWRHLDHHLRQFGL
jgi:hypothetical protein